MSKGPMSVYIDDAWVHQQGKKWVATVVAFSENDNVLTISACHYSPELAYEGLIAGMKELGVLAGDWEG